jgi:hypothetical protein
MIGDDSDDGDDILLPPYTYKNIFLLCVLLFFYLFALRKEGSSSPSSPITQKLYIASGDDMGDDA